MANNPQQGQANRVGSEEQTFGTRLVERTKQGVVDYIDDTNLGRVLRAANLLPGAERPEGSFTEATWNSTNSTDWRVKLSLPPTSAFTNSVLLAPLAETGNAMVFPYTPAVYITHSANYNALSPTHSNYPFYIYQNSQVDQFTITGDFTVENSKEALYWIAATHYLKSVTKMSYGESTNKGAPPPVVKLNGYGDYVFNNVPVLVQTFNVELGADVDYIKADVGPNGSWAPTKSTIAVTLVPAYSRNAVNKFSLDRFVSGGYVLNDGTGYL